MQSRDDNRNTSLPLFRAAALHARRDSAVGKILLTRPVSFAVMTAIAATLAIALGSYLVIGRFTEKRTIYGRLVTEPASVIIRAPQPGVVTERHVGEGKRVSPGELLLVLSGERISASVGETQAKITDGLESSRGMLEAQVNDLHDREVNERAALLRQIQALAAESEIVATMLDRRLHRMQRAETDLRRFREMLRSAFVSEEEVLAREDLLLEHRAQAEGLRRESSRIALERSDVEHRLNSVDAHYRSERAQLERSLIDIDNELAENEARRRIAVVASIDGIVTAISADVGQMVQASHALLSIVPERSRLKAELYAPSRAMAFVEPGRPMVLRYSAYPFERFGHQRATVIAVTETAMSRAPSMQGDAAAAADEGLYRVTAEIEAQHFQFGRAALKLRPGMAVEGDLLGETRPLYRWMFDPLAALGVR